MTSIQKPPHQEPGPENADIVFVIEDTANLHSHITSFKNSYLIKLIEYVNSLHFRFNL